MINGVAIMSDTDNTKERVTAYYGDIIFKKVAEQTVRIRSFPPMSCPCPRFIVLGWSARFIREALRDPFVTITCYPDDHGR